MFFSPIPQIEWYSIISNANNYKTCKLKTAKQDLHYLSHVEFDNQYTVHGKFNITTIDTRNAILCISYSLSTCAVIKILRTFCHTCKNWCLNSSINVCSLWYKIPSCLSWYVKWSKIGWSDKARSQNYVPIDFRRSHLWSQYHLYERRNREKWYYI